MKTARSKESISLALSCVIQCFGSDVALNFANNVGEEDQEDREPGFPSK